jgi:hypothetical protein
VSFTCKCNGVNGLSGNDTHRTRGALGTKAFSCQRGRGAQGLDRANSKRTKELRAGEIVQYRPPGGDGASPHGDRGFRVKKGVFDVFRD